MLRPDIQLTLESLEVLLRATEAIARDQGLNITARECEEQEHKVAEFIKRTERRA